MGNAAVVDVKKKEEKEKKNRQIDRQTYIEVKYEVKFFFNKLCERQQSERIQFLKIMYDYEM